MQDWKHYLAANPDLLHAGITTEAGAAQHFRNHGRSEGRSTRFDWAQYLAANPDLLHAGITTEAGAVQHFRNHGRSEGRFMRFDWAQYLKANADLRAAGLVSEAQVLQHYLTYGAFEHRKLIPSVLFRNQPRLPVESQIQRRTIVPAPNKINFYQALNITNGSKIIVHVLDKSFGFGDYLRGSILLATYAKHFNVRFRMDVSRHTLAGCMLARQDYLPEECKVDLICFESNEDMDQRMYSLIEEFANSARDTLYVTTNLYYNQDLVSDDIKNVVNSFFTFQPKFYESAKSFVDLPAYTVLHIRCLDSSFGSDFPDDPYLLAEIIKLHLPSTTVVMSNNYGLKTKLNQLFGFHFVDMDAHHFAKADEAGFIDSTVIEYLILSKSSSTYCFSYYQHGSGFSEQCSVLHDIPYSVTYLPSVNAGLWETRLHSAPNVVWPEAGADPSVAFITLTNTGYVEYTMNCIESLKKIGMKQPLQVYCIGHEGCDILSKNGVRAVLIDDESASVFTEFETRNWANVTYRKFEIIYNNLLTHDYVCITDGDIVYENLGMFSFLMANVGENDVLIQSEGLNINDLCSGFMFIRSNETTRRFFNPACVEKYRSVEGGNDQVYVNSIKHLIKYKMLPLDLFPTGNHYYQYHESIANPFLIHFNWIIGHQKRNKMIQYGKWFTSPKVKIFQYGTDGFGHQLEGLLRLSSLAINLKAEYYYDPKRTFTFDHSNLDLTTVSAYLKEACEHLFAPNLEPFNVVTRECRSFHEIIQYDANVKETAYGYDGVSSVLGANQLPPNFEFNQDVQKALPRLRDAFVVRNHFLPPKSYDATYINVCCYIQLGDAVGQRISDNEALISTIKEFQRYGSRYRVIVHTDGNMTSLAVECPNTVVYDSTSDVLQILSDFVHADVFIMNYSSLSIAAHLLAAPSQTVVCPNQADTTFKPRILAKCMTVAEVFQKYKT